MSGTITRADLSDGLNDELDMLDAGVEKIGDISNSNHYLTYRSIAGTISNTFSITDEEIQACKRMGADIAVCVMASVTNTTDSTVDIISNNIVTEALDRIQASAIKPIMIKPHIGLNFLDNFNRKDYLPSDIPTFFNSWTNVLLNYASICNTYNIPILCVSVEMVALTANIYASYWETLYNTIKASYPNILIIHAPKVWEFNDDDHELSLQWADMLGCTMYLSHTYKTFVGDTVDSFEDVGKAYYNNYNNIVKKINQRCYKYNKKFFIAETGCMALEDGLIDVVPKTYSDGSRNTNYYVQASLMDGFFKYFCNNSNIVGFAWWHLKDPFKFWSSTNTLPGEAMMTTYVKGELI